MNSKFSCLFIITFFLAICAIQSFADDIVDLTAKAKEAYRHGNYDAAIDYCNKLLLLNSKEAYLGRSLAYYKKGEYNKALADADEAIHFKPGSSEFEVRGSIYAEQGQPNKAISDYDQAIDLNPKKSLLYGLRATQYGHIKCYDAAIIDCDTAILLLSDTINNEDSGAISSAYCLKGGMLFVKGDYTNSLQSYDLAIQFNTKNAFAYAGRGRLSVWKKDYRESISNYQTAIELSTNDAAIYAGFAWVLANCPDPKIRNGRKALEYAKNACDLTAWKDPNLFDTLACAYAAVGDFEDAIKWEGKFIGSSDLDIVIKPAKERLDLFKQKKAYYLKVK